MPDLKPLLSPTASPSSALGRYPHLARPTTLPDRARLSRAHLSGDPQPAAKYSGSEAIATVAELPEAPDLAVIVVPAAYVVPTLEECGRKGVRAAVVISSGFAEERGDAAQERDRALREVIDRFGIVVCGPNSEGLVNPLKPLVATFSPVFHDPAQSLFPESRKSRAIAVSCQSGALTFAFLSRGLPRQLRFTYQASAGNQTCLEAHDYVDWLLDTGGADIFLAYLEDIRDPARFRAVADKAAEAGKPMIIAKVGRSEAGRRAAASHTGALAHTGAVDDAIFRHHGIIRGEDLDHMLDMAAAFAFCRLPHGNRVAVITGSGGSAVWMSDMLAAHGLELPVLEEDLQQRLMALLPSYASAQNPVDGTAQAIHEVGYAQARRDRARIAADRYHPADRLARQRSDREASAPRNWRRSPAMTEQPIILSTYTTATPGAMARVRRGRHPLLHLDAELRPRDPRAGRLRSVPGAAPSTASCGEDTAGSARRGRAAR